MFSLTKILFKEFLIWVFWDQNVDPGWVKNGKKSFFSYKPPYYQPSFPQKQNS